MELWRYYRIIRQRRWLILACVIVCVGTVFVVEHFFTGQKYTGRTTVMERQPGPEQGVPVYADRYMGPVNPEVHLAELGRIIASRTVMQRTAQTLSVLNISYDPLKLLQTVRVEPVADTGILQIEVTSEDPEEAKAAADVIAAEFKRFYNEVVHGATSQSREFIEKQLKDSLKQLKDAQAKQTEYKRTNNVVQLTQQQQILLNRIAEIKSQAIGARVAEDDANARISVTGLHKDEQEDMKLASKTTSENPIWQSLVSQRAKLEADLAAIQVTKGKKHPDVMTLTEQLDEIRTQLDQTQREIVSAQSLAANPNKTSVLDRYLSAQSDRSAASARKAALEQAIADLQPELEVLPEREMHLAELELNVETAKNTYALLRTKLDEARIKEQESLKSSSIKTIEPSYAIPVDRKLPLKLALALVLSPLLGTGIAFLLYYLDNTVKSPAEAEDLLGLPVFTVIPLGRNHSLVRRPDSVVLSTAYQMISAQLWQAVRDTGRATVAIASAEPDSGRSTTASNLAITLASDGAKVILIDADMRKPNLHLMFGIDNKRGLSNILGGTAAIEDTAHPTRFEGLLFIPAGPAPDNPIRLLRQPQMEAFIEQIRELADFVIFDTPAGITFADSLLVAAHAHNVVIVHSAGRVPRGAESEFRTRLDQMSANLIGVVLNRVRPEDNHGLFHYKRAYQGLVPPNNKVPVSSGVKAISGSESTDDLD